MKRKMKIREFLTRKKVAAGCVAAAAVIAAGSFSMVMQSSDIPELSSYTDPVIETTITGDDTPLASKPKVTTKTKRKTKTTRKKVKLKKASKKSYTKKLPKKKKTTTKTRKSGKKTVKTQTTVQTATTEKYTKKSKQKVVTQKIVTTVKTTTTVAASQQNAQTQEVSFQSSGTQNSGSAKTSSQKASKHTISNVASIAPKMDSRVLNAYARMGFTVTVDPNAAYAGHFDARSRSITIQEADETIYHELGHFLLAKKNGIVVTEFSLGMGPRLFSTQKGETRYSIKLFPIGGSCAMLGEDTGEEELPGTFNAAPVWGRISVVSAGPIFNFVLAFLLSVIITGFVGYDPAEIMEVEKGSPAAEAGLREGDIVTEFDGYTVM